MRSHYCGHVNEGSIGQEVRVAGWVHRRRDHGGVIFVDLRDREGLLQVVFDPDFEEIFTLAERIRSEYVLTIKGTVRERPEGTINPELPTGRVELLARELTVLSESKTPPFHHDEHASEELRLRYRYLDLRRETMQRNLRLRHRIAQSIRSFLDGEGFVELETPILSKTTPEGARDYLVPSRTHPGELLRIAAVTATDEAVADDVGHGSLLPDRQVFSRRGPARRSAARIHSARYRDLVSSIRKSGIMTDDGRR